MVKINYKFLKKRGVMQLVKPNKNLAQNYFLMSVKFFQSAKLLFNNHFYESSTGDFYYSIYNSILALLFFCGIKSENHNASIKLILELFNNKELYDIAQKIKEERIDKQYYHETNATKGDLSEIAKLCQKFNLEVKTIVNDLKAEDIEKIREEFNKLCI